MYFRWTPRATRAAFYGVVLIPAVIYGVAAPSDVCLLLFGSFKTLKSVPDEMEFHRKAQGRSSRGTIITHCAHHSRGSQTNFTFYYPFLRSFIHEMVVTHSLLVPHQFELTLPLIRFAYKALWLSCTQPQ